MLWSNLEKGKPEQKRLEVLLGDVVKTDLPVSILYVLKRAFHIFLLEPLSES